MEHTNDDARLLIELFNTLPKVGENLSHLKQVLWNVKDMQHDSPEPWTSEQLGMIIEERTRGVYSSPEELEEGVEQNAKILAILKKRVNTLTFKINHLRND